MLDLAAQYQRLKPELDQAVLSAMAHAAYINGPEVQRFAEEFAAYLGLAHVVPCANGTDALQIALMALQLPEGSEVITPAFSYGAVAEVCTLLGLKPVFADVDQNTFNLDVRELEKHITPHTRVIVPVHLFGQSCDMEPILAIAEKHGLYVIEDNAQSVGAEYTFSDGRTCKTGTMGHFGTTSFFPSKNLACFGDGGALMTNNAQLAEAARMIANHGQKIKYRHDVTGINSRLDTIQAAVLSVKLKYLDAFNAERMAAAAQYNTLLAPVKGIRVPERLKASTHVYHQYTLQVFDVPVPQLSDALKQNGIASMVYYPMPLYRQKAFAYPLNLPVTEALCRSVLSIPMGPGMNPEQISYICSTLIDKINRQ